MLKVHITEILDSNWRTRHARFECPLCSIFGNVQTAQDVDHVLALIGAHMGSSHNVNQVLLKFDKRQWIELHPNDFGLLIDGMACGICGDPMNHGDEPHGEITGDGLTRSDIIDYLNGRGFRPYEEIQ